MSSSSSYGASYAQDKGSYTPRSPSPRSASSSSSASSSLFAHRGNSAKNHRYSSKPGSVEVHNGGGQSSSPNSTSASNAGYYQ